MSQPGERRASRRRGLLVVAAVVALSLATTVVLCAPRFRPIEARALKSPNPTHATFQASDAQVRACLVRTGWEMLHLEAGTGTQLSLMQTTAESGSSNAVFRDPANARDVVLETIGSSALSEAYFIQGEPLLYSLQLHVHLVPTSATETSVEVRCSRYQVTTGTEPTIGHAWSKNVNRDVPPTTIDEYRVLRAIDSCLGKGTLPAPQTP